jgi:UDP-N-acetylmuramoyl-L-alanyl-D-glutamate--2,6-diaminopimelate ligase
MFQKFKNVYHFLTAWVFQIVYGLPARKLKIIGITGTDGKTTTSSLIYHVLKTAGKKVSMISSVSASIGGRELDTGFHVTTPDPHNVPKYLAESVRNGDEYFVLEITSHGLDQHRAAGIQFEISGITNITHEHLGYHGSFANYIRAKSRIAHMSKQTVVNADQKEVTEMIRKNVPKASIITYGLSEKADYSIDISKKYDIYLEKHNKSNFLLAYIVCSKLGVDDETFGRAVHSYKFPPGRMEELYNDKFTIVSDFAHTPNGLDNALSAVLEKYRNRSRMIHVFGAAAFRDDSKRPAMGKISATYANVIILTEEDYRTEDPERIFGMLAQGIEERGFSEIHPKTEKLSIPNKCYMKILNREEAIAKAVAIAQPGDIIMITGKGQEKSLCRGTKEEPYDEKACVHQALSW